MSAYNLLLFAHVSGALGYFSGIALWAAVLAALRRAQRVENIRTLTALMQRSNGVTVISILVLLAAGVTMTVTTWGIATSWIDVALGSLVFLAAINVGFIEPKVRAIAALAVTTQDGPLPNALAIRVRSPLLGALLYLQVPFIVGIVFLMVIKPALTASFAVMACALVLGLAIGLPVWIEADRRE